MHAFSNPLFTIALAAFAALSPAAVQAEGMFSLGRSLSEFSNADREAIKRARMEVLEKMQPGAVSAWNDTSTGHAGEVNLRRVYEKNGMSCGDVEYVMKVPQTARYLAAFCRDGDGAWREAS